VFDVILAMKTDLEMLKTAFGNALKVGPIAELDAKKGYRLKLGEEDGEPYLSPWYPHPESGGQTLSWIPLSEGQIVGVLNPGGDPNQGILLRGGFSGQNGPPSQDLFANLVKALGIEISMKDGLLKIVGNLLVEGNADFNQGHLKAHGKNVGHDHGHVTAPPGPPGPPV
jgi:hypothetical protein